MRLLLDVLAKMRGWIDRDRLVFSIVRCCLTTGKKNPMLSVYTRQSEGHRRAQVEHCTLNEPSQHLGMWRRMLKDDPDSLLCDARMHPMYATSRSLAGLALKAIGLPRMDGNGLSSAYALLRKLKNPSDPMVLMQCDSDCQESQDNLKDRQDLEDRDEEEGGRQFCLACTLGILYAGGRRVQGHKLLTKIKRMVMDMFRPESAPSGEKAMTRVLGGSPSLLVDFLTLGVPVTVQAVTSLAMGLHAREDFETTRMILMQRMCGRRGMRAAWRMVPQALLIKCTPHVLRVMVMEDGYGWMPTCP